MALLDGDLQREIGTNPDLVAIMLDGTLTTYATTLVAGRRVRIPTTTNVRGFLDTQRIVSFGGNTALFQRVAIILGLSRDGAPVPLPRDGDTVELQGQVMTILRSEPDPAAATYTLVLREVGE